MRNKNHKARSLTGDDVKFLLDLQFKMNNTASDIFYMVMDEDKIYGIDTDFEYDGIEITLEGETIATNMKELYEYIKDSHSLKMEYIKNSVEETVIINDDEYFSVRELVDYLNDELDYRFVEIITYKKVNKLIDNTFFLTLEECENHIKSNKHHYNNAKPCAMNIWRSPQVTKLYEILKNVVWEEYIV